eukprot:CAMPEP_0119334480 /NCGR_PEP_ID=MMETSP1333-20130426/87425_1 /TAXON_ID=418940 /ORGANISM="Scyphosphaera apsteinii, Strain RCC1455" /LENGTH=115 /DNA_ID=CAMNT_0007344781 /DNA_START=36 /DNA_END=384 /DNA_ORIENTATION=+
MVLQLQYKDFLDNEQSIEVPSWDVHVQATQDSIDDEETPCPDSFADIEETVAYPMWEDERRVFVLKVEDVEELYIFRADGTPFTGTSSTPMGVRSSQVRKASLGNGGKGLLGGLL